MPKADTFQPPPKRWYLPAMEAFADVVAALKTSNTTTSPPFHAEAATKHRTFSCFAGAVTAANRTAACVKSTTAA